MTLLSTKQQKILDYISHFWKSAGYPPTVRDIVSGCSISSTSVVDYNLDILKKKGYIRRHSGISRGIELLSRSFDPDNKIHVPIIGQIAAGEPIPVPEADTWSTVADEDVLDLAAELTGGRTGVYALRVKGSSMIDALINDGDIVLMEHVNVVEDGEMAAIWLKAEKEVTLKKIYREPRRIRLQPANKQMEPIFTEPENVEVQGKVIGVLRQLG